ncbi:hypothetical protein BAC_A0151 (plasmid) [Bacillus anthracis str. A0488]|nr:hypothetical protein BAA_A0100 [Bacillus anthracis str. A0248]AHK41719.1 hypothetical protein BAPAT_pXO10099 [Bacillus anthracis str. SVA11]EDR16424.1 hypothetical protein BAC_A0151 [Bacillus anthracis str. A0488]EDS94394.1 hypothetical protein BAK_A0234 [Bacillus anthracis str. A0389]EDT17068.1 hypothetical protein BAM_A0011 [Bacillus anthracis str. A0465]EDT64858.1 hypothetical protein BAO_A0087 [Bacillus anthracis str. A0174]EDV13411.1 hypothetical protein BATI_B0100 [Bacillus anthracis
MLSWTVAAFEPLLFLPSPPVKLSFASKKSPTDVVISFADNQFNIIPAPPGDFARKTQKDPNIRTRPLRTWRILRSSLICELINFIFYCKILLRLYYSNTILKIQPLIYTFIIF